MTHYFKCNRSGCYVPKGTGKRKLKVSGSRKINALCPSLITCIQYKTGECEVRFVKAHAGHANEIKHIDLSKSEKDWAASKLALQVNKGVILDEVRGAKMNGELKRIHVLTNKDLLNLIQRRNLSYLKKRHQSDVISVQAWVNEMKTLGAFDPVLFYKAQVNVESSLGDEGTQGSESPNQRDVGKASHCLETLLPVAAHLTAQDLFLAIMNEGQVEMLQKFGGDIIAIDSTHGTNDYAFQLTTIMVLDENRAGYACAYLYSNRIDEATIRTFFELIRGKAGNVLTRTFMSDDYPAYFNAWTAVMGKPSNHLICSWHVQHSWAKHYNEISTPELRKEVKSALECTQKETDLITFEAMRKGFIAKYSCNEKCKKFLDYYLTYYDKRVETWSYAFRRELGINTNMHIERYHGRLKHIYMQGKKVKRLDQSIEALMKFNRDQQFSRVINLTKGVLSGKLADARRKHSHAIQMKVTAIKTKENAESQTWAVQSENEKKSQIYDIVIDNKQDCKCNMKCDDCHVCVHCTRCTCCDYLIRLHLCKHIHFVCINIAGPSLNSEQSGDEIPFAPSLLINEDDGERNGEVALHVKELSVSGRSVTDIDKMREKLISSTLIVLQSANTSEELEAAANILKPLETTVLAARDSNIVKTPPSFSSQCNSQTSKKRLIEKQTRFFSTTKRRRKLFDRTSNENIALDLVSFAEGIQGKESPACEINNDERE